MQVIGRDGRDDRIRGFWALIVTQFQGAFSDNVYRTLAMFMIIGMTLPHFPDASREFKMALVGGLFAVPFILLSMTGGYLADRLSKRTVVIGTKLAEIVIMAVALAALLVREPWLILLTVLLMGSQSACFGPSKYGLLPELLSKQRLSWGNGIMELGTFLAIITGTIAGGWLFIGFQGREWGAGIVLIALAVAGLISSLGIDRLPAADAARHWRANFLGDLWTQLRRISKDRVLSLAIMGNTYFIFMAALIQQYTVYAYGKDLLGLHEGEITLYLMSAIAVGIGVGSFSAGYLSGRKIEYGLIPLGALGMTVFGSLMTLPGRTVLEAVLSLGLYGFSAGFFVVPIAALIQHRPDAGHKGSIIAASSMLSFIGIFLAAGAFYLLAGILQLNPREIFGVTTVMIFGGTLYALWLLPDAFVRFLLWLLTRSLYRLKVEGREHIPAKGGALFVCNHLSMVDALLLQASTDRPIRFIMYKGSYQKPWVRPLASIMRVIPISAHVRPREMIHALRTATDAIRNGEVVCIFAEGQITRIGQMLPFRRGFERIMKGLDAPIIPICLDGVWGSIFSFEKQRFLWKLPRRIPYPITICYGQPLPPTANHIEVRQVVQELGVDAWMHRKARMETMDRAIFRTARKVPFRMAMADGQVPSLAYGTMLTRAVFLARRLKRVWAGEEMVGILLPPSVGGALVNIAAFLLGKVPVNLNYTLSDEGIASCASQCRLKTVITSRQFLEKVKLQVPGKAVFIEEVAGQPRFGEKVAAFLTAHLMPVRLAEAAFGRRKRTRPDDLATVIFSSGSTGDPKGVMLSHFNIMSNVEQLEQIFAVTPADRFLGILPFFHSFGFTGTICLPLSVGIGVAFHPNPLDAPGIAKLVRQHALSFLVATPTFLQIFLRGCEPGDFGSLRYVVAGAEKLPERLASAFEDKFGLRPLEGYGCTECSPAVAINTYDFRSAGFRQTGAKRGSIGHPLPGMAVRIVDESTFEPRPLGEPGLLLVKGPNVMTGYLGKPEKTAKALREGWYVTGDIATLDEDGFLHITDRLSRFSKIGGEMVPHIKVEEQLQELAGLTEQAFVVTGVPDEKKGERLVVLHTLADKPLQECIDKLVTSSLPNLWKPKPDAFVRIDSLPYLGSGKMDLKKVRDLACFACQP
jgi:acyl-[acyl-carrier-protein]-phospholipid O-acyltransferase/long-chain-fatty-acid--[acyl-carrier-protein] ligase